MKPFALGISFFIASIVCVGQEGRSIRFEATLGENPVQLGVNYPLAGVDSLTFEALRFYVSSVKLLNDGKEVWAEKDSYHLLDASIPKSMEIRIPTNSSANELVFLLGTDSLTNVSGAMGGDLDPSKGMYWAWNSGYINFKLEGTSPACNTRNHEFEFHLGGYVYPNATVQEVRLPLSPSSVIKIDLALFFKQVDLKSVNHIMSPSSKAVELAKLASGIFSFGDEN